MESIQIRKGQLQDLNMLAHFNSANALESEGLVLDAKLAQEGVLAVLEDAGKGVYIVAYNGDEMLGSLMITREWSDWRACWKWWLQSVYVVPAFRGQGVFESMCKFVEEEARQEGVPSLSLYMEHNNDRASKAYIKNGFVESHYVMLEKELSVKK